MMKPTGLGNSLSLSPSLCPNLSRSTPLFPFKAWHVSLFWGLEGEGGSLKTCCSSGFPQEEQFNEVRRPCDNISGQFSQIWGPVIGALNKKGRLTIRTPKGSTF